FIAGERIPHEASPASIPQRHVAEDSAGEIPDMSPGKRAIVVVLLAMLSPERAIRFKNLIISMEGLQGCIEFRFNNGCMDGFSKAFRDDLLLPQQLELVQWLALQAFLSIFRTKMPDIIVHLTSVDDVLTGSRHYE
ncbi:hypothetical protein Tco_1447448, partial [Tanacetum coccineum]